MENPNEAILANLDNRVLTITLNRPEAKNAITPDMTIKLHELLTEAATNTDIGAIILTGADGAFCAGGDVKKMSSGPATTHTHSREQIITLGAECTQLLHEMPKPTIAMIPGAAAGAGLALATGCDLRFSTPTAKLTFAYTKIGLSGDYGGSYFLQHWVGPSKARELSLLCPVILATEAQEIGLINTVVPEDELKTYTYSVAANLANGPTDALGKIKDNLNSSYRPSITESITTEKKNFISCRESSEHKEAIAAFLEKRQPVFHGEK